MRSPPSAQRGFTYLGLLVAVAIMGLMLTLVSRVWSTTEQRERETQLLFVGHAYRLAIASFYANGHRFPSTLDELLQDDRFPVPKHHLRRLYPDPMTGHADWTPVLTADGQGIMGIGSSSRAAPIKRRNFDLADEGFRDTDCYCFWQFVYHPNRFSRAVNPAGGASPTPGNGTPSKPGTPAFNPGHLTPLPPGSGSLMPTPGSTVPSTSDPTGSN